MYSSICFIIVSDQICYLVLLLDHDSGICGGSSLFCISQGGVITFLVSTKGGHVFLWGVLLAANGPLR